MKFSFNHIFSSNQVASITQTDTPKRTPSDSRAKKMEKLKVQRFKEFAIQPFVFDLEEKVYSSKMIEDPPSAQELKSPKSEQPDKSD